MEQRMFEQEIQDIAARVDAKARIILLKLARLLTP